MAGSQKQSNSVPSCADPILVARLETIKQLAGGSSDRVAVLDRDSNVTYANESSWSEHTSAFCKWAGKRLNTEAG